MLYDGLLQSAATTGDGTAVNLGLAGPTDADLTFYIKGSSGVSAGAVQLEEADSVDYAGTWSALGSAITVTASTITVQRESGAFRAVRARISTDIVGGTVDVRLTAYGDLV